jgi:thiamine-phosphate pyrophosphorylase
MLFIITHYLAIESNMPKRQARSFPKTWLMTDERLGEGLIASIAALPGGSGIVFRHYSLDTRARTALFRKVSALARRHRHMLVVGGPPIAAPAWQAAGRHARVRRAMTAPVHTLREAIAAERAGAALLFVSPVFATRSHPEGVGLGRVRFGLLIRNLNTPVIALGGMTKARARNLKAMKIYGWAAISALAAKR